MKQIKTITLILILLFLVFQSISQTQTIIDWNAQWSYFKGKSEPSNPINSWRVSGFNATAWPKGNAPFRYGDGTGGTLLSDMLNNYTTCYIRKEIVLNTDDFDQLRIYCDYDDGFVVWINGQEVMKANVGSDYSYNQGAINSHEFGEWTSILLDADDLNLVNGTNIIAIQGFNISKVSTDFYLNIKLETIKKLPETGKASISVRSGFYTQPFTTTISTEKSGEAIKYTLDGSDPRYSSTAISKVSPVNVVIDPNSTVGGRGKTGGVVLRASKFETGFDPSKPVTQTYIFATAVRNQTNPGGSWPVNSVNDQRIDLPMDTKVTSDPRYNNLIESSLLDIPSISITTDMGHLFNAQTGIYVNAEYHGSDWERPANVELINPDGSPGFNIDAGLRIRGGWSRHGDYPKHAFRFFFRSDYGEGKLKYPLFGDEGVNEFDKIDLRTGQNYAWANGGDHAKYQTLNRDLFSRDTQRDMNQPHTRSRAYHLYLNGLYWGLYQTQERSEASFAESYFGGGTDDYDVIKVDIGDNFNLYEIEATDGNTASWEKIWTLCQSGFTTNTNYFKLLGFNTSGIRDTALPIMVDIDNLIDYMLVIFYGGNFDAPVSKFSNNDNPNNFYAIYDRTDKNQGYRFFAHDAEHSLLTDAVSPGIGIQENRVNLGTVQDMYVNRFQKFHPQWLHFRLLSNAEYRQRFADRVYKHFFNQGALTPDSCKARFKKTADEIDMAIIAESARWGDSKSNWARTKDDHWLPAVNQVLNDYLPYRSDIVLQQLIAENLYFTIQPPVFKHNGTVITDEKITISENYGLLLEHSNAAGEIFYTTNGTDPRTIGGGTATTAINVGNSKSISITPGTILKSRVKNGSNWSALHEIYFDDSGLFTAFKVTELHYHPIDQNGVDGKELEFIEFKNTGSKTIDISGVSITDGIQFTFPAGTTIAPGNLMVVASNAVEFNNIYGFQPQFVYAGSLSNGGEQVIIQASSNQVIISFTFDDEDPWPTEPDGNGYSLVSVEKNPTLNPDSVTYWTISKYTNGSPDADDEMSVTANEELAISQNQRFEIYPNPASSEFYIDFTIENNEKVEVLLFDVNGRLIETLINENRFSGNHNLLLRPQKQPGAGIYIVALKTSKSVQTKKLIIQP
ncbi:MAG: lamin tail domain-containing protein [Draconibacterium sp.]